MPIVLNGETRLYPILGDPIIYAKSPELLTNSFQARGHNAICVPMQVPDGMLGEVMNGLTLVPNIDGILVTMPHKFNITSFCSTLSKTSQILGAVSVIRRNADGTWHGDSQDGDAFVKAQIDHEAPVKGARALLIGAGGAGSAIAISLLSAGVRELIIYDIDQARVHELIDHLGDLTEGRVKYGPPDPTGCDMLCHATHLGMVKDDPLPVDPKLFSPALFVGDVIAGHGTTPLLAAAKNIGCQIVSGDQMVEAVQDMMVDYMTNSE